MDALQRRERLSVLLLQLYRALPSMFCLEGWGEAVWPWRALWHRWRIQGPYLLSLIEFDVVTLSCFPPRNAGNIGHRGVKAQDGREPLTQHDR